MSSEISGTSSSVDTPVLPTVHNPGSNPKKIKAYYKALRLQLASERRYETFLKKVERVNEKILKEKEALFTECMKTAKAIKEAGVKI